MQTSVTREQRAGESPPASPSHHLLPPPTTPALHVFPLHLDSTWPRRWVTRQLSISCPACSLGPHAVSPNVGDTASDQSNLSFPPRHNPGAQKSGTCGVYVWSMNGRTWGVLLDRKGHLKPIRQAPASVTQSCEPSLSRSCTSLPDQRPLSPVLLAQHCTALDPSAHTLNRFHFQFRALEIAFFCLAVPRESVVSC